MPLYTLYTEWLSLLTRPKHGVMTNPGVLQSKKARDTRCPEIKSVNPRWLTSVLFLKLGFVHLPLKSRKFRKLRGMIISFERFNKVVVYLQTHFHMRLNDIFVFLSKAWHPRRYAIIRQNGVGSGWQHRSDSDLIWHNVGDSNTSGQVGSKDELTIFCKFPSDTLLSGDYK